MQSSVGNRKSPCPIPHSPFRGGQGTIEYLLVLVAILLAVLFAASANGPIQAAIGSVSSDASNVITNTVNDVKGRLGL